MQVIYEVRKEVNHSEKLYPVATASNGAAAQKKANELNKILASNKAIFEGLLSKLRFRLNGNVSLFEAKELAQYEVLDGILDIHEYRAEFINDKRVSKYNPQDDVTKIEPTKEQIERTKKARIEAGIDEPEEKKETKSSTKKSKKTKTSKTALKLLKEAGIKESEVAGTGKDGGITIKDAEAAIKAKEEAEIEAATKPDEKDDENNPKAEAPKE